MLVLLSLWKVALAVVLISFFGVRRPIVAAWHYLPYTTLHDYTTQLSFGIIPAHIPAATTDLLISSLHLDYIVFSLILVEQVTAELNYEAIWFRDLYYRAVNLSAASQPSISQGLFAIDWSFREVLVLNSNLPTTAAPIAKITQFNDSKRIELNHRCWVSHFCYGALCRWHR